MNWSFFLCFTYSWDGLWTPYCIRTLCWFGAFWWTCALLLLVRNMLLRYSLVYWALLTSSIRAVYDTFTDFYLLISFTACLEAGRFGACKARRSHIRSKTTHADSKMYQKLRTICSILSKQIELHFVAKILWTDLTDKGICSLGFEAWRRRERWQIRRGRTGTP